MHNNRYDNFVYIGSWIAGGLSMVVVVFLFFSLVNGSGSMTSVLTDQFVATKNVVHFEAELKVQTDPRKRRILEGLLADEKAKLAALADDAKNGQR